MAGIYRTFFQLTGFSGSLGPKETMVFDATRRNREYEGLSYRSWIGSWSTSESWSESRGDSGGEGATTPSGTAV